MKWEKSWQQVTWKDGAKLPPAAVTQKKEKNLVMIQDILYQIPRTGGGKMVGLTGLWKGQTGNFWIGQNCWEGVNPEDILSKIFFFIQTNWFL